MKEQEEPGEEYYRYLNLQIIVRNNFPKPMRLRQGYGISMHPYEHCDSFRPDTIQRLFILRGKKTWGGRTIVKTGISDRIAAISSTDSRFLFSGDKYHPIVIDGANFADEREITKLKEFAEEYFLSTGKSAELLLGRTGYIKQMIEINSGRQNNPLKMTVKILSPEEFLKFKKKESF